MVRVLILSSNNGGGYNAAAAALRDAIASAGGESETLDCVSLLSPFLSCLCSRLHCFVYWHFPQLFRAAYRYTEHHSAMFRKGRPVRAILGLGKRRLARRICEGAFDSVVCAHVFAALLSACPGSGEQKVVAGLRGASISGNTVTVDCRKRRAPTGSGVCLQALSDRSRSR